MNNYQTSAYDNTQSLDQHVSRVMRNVYLKMFLGLLLTAFVAWGIAVTATPGSGFMHLLVTNRWLYWGIAIVEIGLVMGISGGINRMSSPVATLLFLLFSAVNGLTLSLIFAVYTPVSIFKTFLITAGTFGAMTVYGYLTDRDLTKIGSLLTMALFGLMICILVNLFWANSTFEWIISGAGVLIFIGLTAWDTQKIKQMAMQMPEATDGRLATVGALSLYLDFINLFLFLLRFFGSSRD